MRQPQECPYSGEWWWVWQRPGELRPQVLCPLGTWEWGLREHWLQPLPCWDSSLSVCEASTAK